MTEPILPPPIHNLPPKGESKWDKRINRIIAVALVFIAICLGVMLTWATADNEPISLNQSPLPTRTIRDHPTAGGVVYLTADFCKNTDSHGELRISFVSDSHEVFLPMTKEESSKGCHKSELVVLIPENIEPNTYRIKLALTYDVNPLKRNIKQTFYSKPIVIDESSSTNKLPDGVRLEPRNF